MNKSISVDSLGIPAYNWWSEACHGVRQDGYTVYPQPIGMAAAFNPQQMYEVFSQVSDEARANWNRSDHDIFNVPMGVTYYPGNPELSFWCPNINIFRDPRWGRGQETCGEDPYLTGVLGLQTVLGMQGNDKHYYKTHACAKHYAVHSGPEPLRHSYDARVSQRDLWETYLPAFKKLVVEGDVREVMSAYNRYEGVPCSSNDRLLNDILRGKWGFDAIVVTDCDAINNYYTPGQHMTQPDALSAAVEVALKGADLECGKVMIALIEGLQEGRRSGPAATPAPRRASRRARARRPPARGRSPTGNPAGRSSHPAPGRRRARQAARPAGRCRRRPGSAARPCPAGYRTAAPRHTAYARRCADGPGGPPRGRPP